MILKIKILYPAEVSKHMARFENDRSLSYIAIINSYIDLNIKINYWCNFISWEKL